MAKVLRHMIILLFSAKSLRGKAMQELDLLGGEFGERCYEQCAQVLKRGVSTDGDLFIAA